MADTSRQIEALIRAAAEESTSAVEATLGPLPKADLIAAARRAAARALDAERWDNLAYLADFLADVTAAHPPKGGGCSCGAQNEDDGGSGEDAACGCGDDGDTLAASQAPQDCGCAAVPEAVVEQSIFDCVVAVTGKSPDEVAPSEVSKEDIDKIMDCTSESIFGYVVEAAGPPPKLKEVHGSHESPMAATIEFQIIDPETPKGEYMSAQDPGPYVHLADPAEAIAMMAGADDRVIDAASARVLYTYPLGTTGPTPEEKEAHGWVFEERAPNGKFFTRADIARAIAARYAAIYDEEERGSPVAPGYLPGSFNRAPTTGKYEIWGHVLSDLMLHTIRHENGLYKLGVDS